MKITGGTLKGRIVYTSKDKSIRPTTGIVREAIFDILSSKIEDAIVLDCFAGSGILGLEALSRGAKSCTFIDQDLTFVKKNLKHLQLEENTIIRGNVFAKLPHLPIFDCIVADPPYGKLTQRGGVPYTKILVELIDTSSLLNKGGHLFVEDNATISFELKTLTPKRVRKFGNTLLYHFTK